LDALFVTVAAQFTFYLHIREGLACLLARAIRGPHGGGRTMHAPITFHLLIDLNSLEPRPALKLRFRPPTD